MFSRTMTERTEYELSAREQDGSIRGIHITQEKER